MSKVTFRRWVVSVIETVICASILAVGCVAVCYVISFCLRALGVG